ncbi:MAG TPA: hypothetical protein DCE43_22760 [Planctomycetaceae bacterium]|nr:hypothetical protein [Planctomycetaceae bacterium]
MFFMSIFGAPASGKTVYLASLMDRLKEILQLDFRVRFEDTDPVGNARIAINSDALFRNPHPEVSTTINKEIVKTPVGGTFLHTVNFGGADVREFPQAFMYTMQPQDGHPVLDSQGNYGRILCLYDNAGEAFDPSQPRYLETQTAHLAKSNLLLFTFDPTLDARLQLKILEKSPHRLKRIPTISQEPFLQSTATRIRTIRGLNRQDRHDAPLIVVVTKFDVWSDVVGEIDRSAVPWRQVRMAAENGGDATVAMAMDQQMIRDMSDRVRQMLMQTNAEIVSAAETLSADVTYVPVSALGWDNAAVDFTDNEGKLNSNYQVRPGDVRPFWAEVPILYGLSRAMPRLVPVIKAP